ncbi:hypothetical protein [Amycolatopsis suaedae]|uniref:Uncharacterized protein n=1 Tax=Amycolatopsis suaedae TaxID=2510978 RepID=A0A4Q7JGG9_9PSEU|nr:hypothetical protein [Amycolatopsis suaedae]RZQ65894.1 hypothetical protein EWH70_02125 [Amycolatopsis suaedae]
MTASRVYVGGQGEYSELHVLGDGRVLRCCPGERGGQIEIGRDLSAEDRRLLVARIITDEGLTLRE